jgi:hypothetical protein
MFRRSPFLLAGLICACLGGAASELTLTGLTRSGGRVWAYISMADGTGSVTLSLNQDRSGIKLEAVDFKKRLAWVTEGGAKRCLILGGTRQDGKGGESASAPAFSSPAGRLSETIGFGSSVGYGRELDSLHRPEGANAFQPSDAPQPHQDGVGNSVTNDGSANVVNPPHRWVPGEVREPTEDEIYRSKYGQAALEERKRASDRISTFKKGS